MDAVKLRERGQVPEYNSCNCRRIYYSIKTNTATALRCS